MVLAGALATATIYANVHAASCLDKKSWLLQKLAGSNAMHVKMHVVRAAAAAFDAKRQQGSSLGEKSVSPPEPDARTARTDPSNRSDAFYGDVQGLASVHAPFFVRSAPSSCTRNRLPCFKTGRPKGNQSGSESGPVEHPPASQENGLAAWLVPIATVCR